MTLLLQWLAGPILRLVLAHFDRRIAARGESERLSADLAATAIRSEMEARSHARAVLLAEQGSFFTAARLVLCRQLSRAIRRCSARRRPAPRRRQSAAS